MFTRLFALPAALLLAACQTPGGQGSTTTDGSDTSTDTGAITTGEPCPVGSLECPCTPGGACDSTLVCEAGTCVDGCAVGSLGCRCTDGGGCDAGATCEAGTCIEGLSPTCSTEQVMDDCCGDGVLDAFEECDTMHENGDDMACTSKCKTAVCGDGLVHEMVNGGEEVCDDGNNVAGDGCTDCALDSCGNGVIDPDEMCEQSGPDDVECTAKCTDARKIIFVSSVHYNGGEIGGVAGGDAKCQALADAAGLPGEFKSLLATSDEDEPLARFTWLDGPYVDVLGNIMFETWSEICSGFAEVGTILTETGEPHPGCAMPFQGSMIWTWGGGKGFTTPALTCGKWDRMDDVGKGTRIEPGLHCLTDNDGMPCSAAAPIICVEQ